MTTLLDQMHVMLMESFAPLMLEVIDDSAQHAGHAGARAQGESHFTVKIVSDVFKGMSRVARHRAVYAPLQPLFVAGLHALIIDAKAPGE